MLRDMSDIVIRVEKLAKRYKLGEAQRGLATLGEAVRRATDASFRTVSSVFYGRKSPDHDYVDGEDILWALKGVSFEIKHGEIVGLIGRNGSGKSTLLKILSRITEPTGGFADIKGQVRSLLEVGTGFQPQLSGRENIYLNGVILGMKQAEIEKKFDQIVDFSGVEKFIDTPLKRYSSGMQVRLAFAVAAHLEPDILIVDEVLAVGDARFQKKCINKMQDVGQQGRTVIFVSHDMQAINRLCQRTILLDEGRLVTDGPSHQTVRAYLDSGLRTTSERQWPDPAKAPSGEVARLRAVRVRTEDGRVTETVDIRRPAEIEMEYEVIESGHILLPYYDIYNGDGLCIFSTNDLDPAWRRRPRPEGHWVSTVLIPGDLLAEGAHFVAPGVVKLNPTVSQFEERDAITFQVVDSLDGDSARGEWAGKVDGVMRPRLKWKTQFTPSEPESDADSNHTARP